ncbi:helix-hairpin-helix domain-containing protein [Streptomyces sp. 6N223]|uniref:helix-hairpin-helix domain-containing protein n=1 Tax=Streptomyces sp. 6N223 TaxID=3457412 RepID=UPI003FD1188C
MKTTRPPRRPPRPGRPPGRHRRHPTTRRAPQRTAATTTTHTRAMALFGPVPARAENAEAAFGPAHAPTTGPARAQAAARARDRTGPPSPAPATDPVSGPLTGVAPDRGPAPPGRTTRPAGGSGGATTADPAQRPRRSPAFGSRQAPPPGRAGPAAPAEGAGGAPATQAAERPERARTIGLAHTRATPSDPAPASALGSDAAGTVGPAQRHRPAPAPPQPRAGWAVLARRARERAAALTSPRSGVLRSRFGMEWKTLAALGVVLLAAVVFAVHHFWTGRPQGVVAAEPVPTAAGPSAAALPAAETAETEEAAAENTVVVDVGGEVRDPGVYTLPAGSRVADAIEAAGGSRPGTDTDSLNRARPLADGEQILVGVTPAPTAPVPEAGPAATATAIAALSLNTATAEQFDTLPGIGPVLAANIVAYREESGGFTTVDQLLDVSGIGESRLSELRDHVTL